MKSKIAVVMPVYNAEIFLETELESVLNQSFKEFTLICVNDNSNDNCEKILKNYAKKDTRIIILSHNKNKGPGIARNTGIDYIFANLQDVEYIHFIDADDRIIPNTYEISYKEAKKSCVEILNFNFTPSTSWEYDLLTIDNFTDYIGNCVEAIFDHSEFYTFIVCWTKLYKKELLRNIRFSSYNFFEDGEFSYKVLSRANSLRVIPNKFYIYNIENQKSSCKKINGKKRLNSIFKIIKSACKDWTNIGIFEKYKFKYIQHIFLYISLVCPDVLKANYINELKNSFCFDILEEKFFESLPNETKEIINKMTTTL